MMSAPASSQRRIWSIVALASDGRRVGHRLDGDRRVAADGNAADHDLARVAALDIAPGPNGHGARYRLHAGISAKLILGKSRGFGISVIALHQDSGGQAECGRWPYFA